MSDDRDDVDGFDIDEAYEHAAEVAHRKRIEELEAIGAAECFVPDEEYIDELAKFRVIDGGKAGADGAGNGAGADARGGNGTNNTASGGSLGMPPLLVIKPAYRPDIKLEAPYAAITYPPIEAPASLLNLELKPSMYPTSGFIQQYLEWLVPTTDAPVAFHVATALAILSATLGRRWAVSYRGGALFPNLFQLLIAGSGARKSTAMKVISMLLRATDIQYGAPQSARTFVCDTLTHNPTVLMYFDEASAFVGMREHKYSADILSLLTTAYDGNTISYASQAAKGRHDVPAPAPSILTGSPLQWLREKRLTDDFLRGGIFARFMLIPAARTDHKLSPPPPDPAVRMHLVRWLESLRSMSTKTNDDRGILIPLTVPLDHEAEQLFASWEHNRGDSAELDLSGIWNRAGDHVLKLALLFHVAAVRGPTEPIHGDVMRQAISFVHEYVLPGHLWAVRRLGDASPYRRLQMEIEELLDARPEGLNYRTLSRELGSPPRFTVEAIYGLYSAGVVSFIAWQRGMGRPTTVITRKGRPPIGRPGYYVCDYLPKSVREYAERDADAEPEPEPDVEGYAPADHEEPPGDLEE